MTVNFGMQFGPTGGPRSLVTGAAFFDHFIGSSISSTVNVATWADVSDSGGSALLGTGTDSEPHGVVIITAGTGGDDGGIELNGAPFKLSRSDNATFGCRFKVSSVAANTGNIFVGLHEEAFDVASGVITNNHMGFVVKTGNPDRLWAVSADDTTQTTTDTSTDLVADTYVTVRIDWKALSQKLVFSIDGSRVATHTATSDNVPLETQNMTMGLHAEGATVTRNLIADWILYGTEYDE